MISVVCKMMLSNSDLKSILDRLIIPLTREADLETDV
jgi:hypothetical protein